MEVLNTAVGVASLFLAGFAIWLSLHLYTRAKDAEQETKTALAAIRAQSEALQRLTGRWMDRFTRHATEPRPADEGLLQLVQVVASLPNTILAHVTAVQSSAAPQLMRELVDSYIGLYCYTAIANVFAQPFLPDESVFDPHDPVHVDTSALIDRTANDFQLMANVLTRSDQSLIKTSSLRGLLDEALNRWRPLVRSASQVFEFRRRESEPSQGSA